MNRLSFLLTLCLLIPATTRAAEFVSFQGKTGPGVGKHIVLVSGDEEYRSEEALPQLARILAERHGFKCTVLFAIDPATGSIDPTVRTNLPGADALDSADVIVMALRFREWPDAQMKHFVDAFQAGKPIIALRTSTHAFNYTDNPSSQYARYSWADKRWPGGFGKQVLGETWVAHHGAHKKEATRGVIESANASDPLLRGVSDVFGDTDVYTANPPADARILLRGQVLAGMEPTDLPVQGAKNNPLQPVAWTRDFKNESGRTNWIFCTTMGAATDLKNEGLRRLLVNAVYRGAGLPVPEKADVSLVGRYRPSMYGFGGFIKNVKPADIQNQKDSASPSAATGQLKFESDDHVAIIGGAMADRFQHSGWLETFIQAANPDAKLVFRNLAMAGDEVALRHRPENFGSADDWLKKVQASVVLAFFGFNESFRGPEGLPRFRKDLEQFIQDTVKANYSGKGTPRLVLFSPIANERHQDPNFPDPTANNANLKLFTEAMREVAAANGIPFVDLFTPSQRLFADAARRGRSLTVDGMYLTEGGDAFLATALFEALTGKPAPAADSVARLRQAVNEKNAQWHARYRTIDGYNVYGGRSALAYQGGKPGFITDRNAPEPHVSNYKVLQEEMAQRDVMTANRDRRVWAVAQGGDLVVQDTNLPPVTPVESNFDPTKTNGAIKFLGGEEAIGQMKIPKNLVVNLFASEERFPELIAPVQMAWDARGRLWVAVWPNYPERKPDSKTGDSLLIFEDTDGDAKADKCSHFADNLNGPTGFQFYKDGVLLVQAPDLWFIRDTDGDGRADTRERILMGLSSADSHHTANSLCLDPGGALYLSDGVFHRTAVETARGPVRNRDGAIYRFEPRTGRFETYVSYGFANPHGRVFDYWGNDIITDATGNNNYFAPAFSGHIDYPAKHSNLNDFWKRPSRPCPGTTLLTSRHFPEEFQGNFLNLNVIGFQGIFRVKVSEDGSGLKGQTLEDLVSSSDPYFRPSAAGVGADGALYFTDWYNPLIGHMQHHLRDPNRDHAHGRIYRMTYAGRPLMRPPRIVGEPILKLLELLREPENQIREFAKIELGNHASGEVVAAVQQWTDGLRSSDPLHEHLMTEALWIYQWHNIVNIGLLDRVLHSPEPRARAAAARVLCYWRDRVPDSLARFKAIAEDSNPRVRLEAVRAASFFSGPAALEAALAILKQPTDYYLDYTLKETLRQLEPARKQVLEIGLPFATDNPAGRDYFLRSVPTHELLALTRSPLVLETLIKRADATDQDRQRALIELAELRKTNRVSVLMTEIQTAAVTPNAQATLARLLPIQLSEELKAFRPPLAKLATSGSTPGLRQPAWAAIISADGSFDAAWREAAGTSEGVADILGAIPWLTDPDFRNTAYDRVQPLLKDRSAESRRGAIDALVSMSRDRDAVFAALTEMIAADQYVVPAARGLRAIPRAKWPKEQAGKAATALVAWAGKVPVNDRTTAEYGEIIQLASDLTAYLPPDAATKARQQIKSLRVPLFVLRTVREQMRFDTPRLVVEAGKPFEIVFENADFMPHNVLVIKPGTREKVGTAAAAMKPTDLDEKGRAYVPDSPDILGATRLLDNGQHESLKLTAPSAEGDCEYVCTFPGHYQIMWGRLVVTKDVDAWLAANPQPSLPPPSAGEDEHKHHN